MPDSTIQRRPVSGQRVSAASIGAAVELREDLALPLWQRVLRLQALPAVVSLVLVMSYFSTQSPFFLTARNMSNLLVGIAPLVLVALGQILVILVKEIDLSLGSLTGFTAAEFAVRLHDGMAWQTAMVVALLLGAVIGAVQGTIVVYGRIASFVVTLGGYLVLLGLQLRVLGDSGGVATTNAFVVNLTVSAVSSILLWVVGGVFWIAWTASVVVRLRSEVALPCPPLWRALVAPAFGLLAVVAVPAYFYTYGVPLAFVVVCVTVGVVAVLLRETVWGRHLYAVGGNAESMRRAGGRVNLLRVGAFVLAGVFSAAGGIMFVSSDQGAGTLTGGGTLLLQAIGVAVVGGVALQGGRGSVWAAITGALVLGGVNNGMNFTTNDASTKYVVQGMVVILVLLADSAVRSLGDGTRVGSRLAGLRRGRAS